MELREFISSLSPKSIRETTLYVAYYVEYIADKGSFTTADIAAGFVEARIKSARNPSDSISKCKKTGEIIELRPKTYSLSNATTKSISEKLNSLGWFTSKPDEPTARVREVSEKLHHDVLTIVDPDERSFLEEAMACLHPPVNAYRAAVIMGWAACVGNLRRKLLAQGLGVIDAEVKKHYPKKRVEKEADLEDLKDSELLVVCQGLGLFTKNVRQQLGHQLELRNGCAHPTAVRPQLHRVMSFFEEVIQYVLSVP